MPLLYPRGGPWIIGPEFTRSSMDLAREDFAFSQTGLLSESQFIAEIAKRGLRVERGELEQLHRRGLVVPFFRIHSRPVELGTDRIPGLQAPGTEWQVYRESALGLLSDPAARRFRRWPARIGPALFYSPYQLMGTRALRLALSMMTARRNGDAIAWDLPPVDYHLRTMFQQLRRLAIVLERLSPRYLPRLTRVLHSPDDSLWDLVNDHDPFPEAQFLSDLDMDTMERQAELLLIDARSFDPLGDWHRVVRIARPSRWTALKHDALLAQEQRMAAELILQFLEDQAAHGRRPAIPPVSTEWREPRHDRLSIEPRERAETVMDFDLSDRPALVLAVEGQTEVRILDRLLVLAGYERRSTWVRVVDLEGVGGDVNLLARSVAVPLLDPEGYRGARILAPLTALMVVADPEGPKYRTPAACARTLDGMKGAVLQSLPASLRGEQVRRDLDHLIHLRTWGEEFEFAHFTDRELATAIRSVVGRGRTPPYRDLVADLARARAARDALKRVWRSWPRRPSKPELADALWPTLERHIMRPSSRRKIPIVGVVEEAIRVAQEVRHAREMNVGEDAP